MNFENIIKSADNLKSFLPITKWLPTYNKDKAVGDFTAGLTVALTVIPQSLAYANLAGLPVQYGLYSSFMGVFLYTLLGTSKDVTLGPTAIMSLIVRKEESLSCDKLSLIEFSLSIGIHFGEQKFLLLSKAKT